MLAHRDWIRRRIEDYRAGVVAAILRNAHRAKGSKASEPSDFFHSLRDDVNHVSVKRKNVQTPEQQLAIFRMLTGAQVIQ